MKTEEVIEKLDGLKERSQCRFKRYIVFQYCNVYPAGGMGDISSSFDTIEEAYEYTINNEYDNNEVIDRDTWEVVELHDNIGIDDNESSGSVDDFEGLTEAVDHFYKEQFANTSKDEVVTNEEMKKYILELGCCDMIAMKAEERVTVKMTEKTIEKKQ